MLNILRASLLTRRATIDYPKSTEAATFRGRPQIDPERCRPGQVHSRCQSCLCAEVCPSKAITLADGADGAWRWQLDIARCLFCGLCEEHCPNGAISLTNDFELASRTRDDLIVGVTSGQEPRIRAGETEHFRRPAVPADDSDRVGERIRRLLKRSLHVRHLAAGSENGCDWEIAALLNPVYDVQRLGIDFVASPRHADLLLVTGAVTRHLEPALLATYEAMPAPRLVVAVGAEACSGGVLQGSYAVAGGVDHCLPVDVYVPGDPPRPQAIIQGLLIAVQRLEPKIRRLELSASQH
ncbi:MAG: NADH-quinone oxidoreductase subunit NuoB [Dehalococcoidia bacterium]|nr:NADH-quinone oxidoreductase subunit NuoB [Dehalococcoidia bacterium]